ncbi:MAG: helix-turn-helix transcriptional regulator [Atopobiaceae bacterium]|nr:helix-turn-helix transcriptional regulator [Atopobiaceae bacterium]MBQ6521339.1 helix-turn-helix transcriptional regulator [Atopobiaceae bacterium]
MDAENKSESVVCSRLTEALLELMAEKPYEDITIRELADRAEVARVSFYRHFKSKDDVLAQDARRLIEGFLASLDPNLRSYDSRAFVEALLKHMQAQDASIQLLIKSGRMDIVRTEFDRAFEVGGTDRRDSARRRFLSGGLYNLFYKWALDGYDPDAAQIAEFVCELVG